MDTGKISIGVALDRELAGALDQYAQATSLSRSDAARRALTIGLPLLAGGVNPDIKRLVFLLENVNLGLTLLLDKAHPDDLPKIIELAAANVETHHG